MKPDAESRYSRKLAPMAAFALPVLMAAVLVGCSDDDDNPGTGGDNGSAPLKRFASVPLDAEITGLFISDAGDLFMNVQHPADSNAAPYGKATVGVITGVDINELPRSFETAAVPSTDAEKQSVVTAIGSYAILGQEGDTFGGAVPFGLGGITSKDDAALIRVSNDPDFNAFVSTGNNTGYLFTNWEDRPGGMSRLALLKSGGEWSVTDAEMIDFSSVDGTWVNCFGTLSPWGTPLTSEELYFDDTVHWNDPAFDDFGHQTNIQDLTDHLGHFPNPYRLGWIVELTQPAGNVAPVKQFALGRYSHENAVVMPDRKTVYLTSDGSHQAFFKFVAEESGDLSSGTLFAAKVTQDDDSDPATTGFDVSWIPLANGSNGEIEGWVAEYDDIDQADFGTANDYITDEEIEEWAAGNATDDRAAFLESVKAAGAKGATAEFNKMEGINIHLGGAADGSIPYMYVAMSDVSGSMSDGEGDIDLEENRCGVVYRLPLDEDYDTSRMEPVVAGGPYDENNEANACSTESISNPDNLVILDDGRVIIGEDSGNHENNTLWVFDPEAKTE